MEFDEGLLGRPKDIVAHPKAGLQVVNVVSGAKRVRSSHFVCDGFGFGWKSIRMVCQSCVGVMHISR